METMTTPGPCQADTVVAVLRNDGYFAYWCLHLRGASCVYVVHYRKG